MSYDRAELPQAKTQPARSGAGAATALCYWAAEFFFLPDERRSEPPLTGRTSLSGRGPPCASVTQTAVAHTLNRVGHFRVGPVNLSSRVYPFGRPFRPEG